MTKALSKLSLVIISISISLSHTHTRPIRIIIPCPSCQDPSGFLQKLHLKYSKTLITANNGKWTQHLRSKIKIWVRNSIRVASEENVQNLLNKDKDKVWYKGKQL